MADRALSGVLLVGGASTRFGSDKALAILDGKTLAERAWRLLGDVCDERIAVGKQEQQLPFPVLLDESEVRAPLAGIVTGIRAARHDVVIVIPVDMPRLTANALRELADACRDAAVPPTGPLPAAFARRTLPVLERALGDGRLRLRDVVAELDAVTVDLDPRVLANVNTPADVQL